MPPKLYAVFHLFAPFVFQLLICILVIKGYKRRWDRIKATRKAASPTA